jgi:CDP-4-dehydro-6-deoxyglucose reductase
MSFQVSVLPSGRQFNVESDESILAAGIRQGITLPYGCKDGACGSCKCKKISGTVVHGPHQSKALSDDEKNQDFILTCSATAQSDLVLESHKVTNESSLPV